KALICNMNYVDNYVLLSIKCVATVYLIKDTSKEEFIKAINTVYEGGKYFSGDVSKALVNSYLNIKDKKPQKPTSITSQYDLTKREKEILALIADGLGNKDIAEKLGKSVRTIETHRFNIMKKLKVNNVVELLKKTEEESLL